MEQPELSDNYQTFPVSAGGAVTAHAFRMEVDGGWCCAETQNDCHREEQQEEYHREEIPEETDHRDAVQEANWHREEERKQGSNCHGQLRRLQDNCNTNQGVHKEENSSQPSKRAVTWQSVGSPHGAGALDEMVTLPGGDERLNSNATPPCGGELKCEVSLPPAGGNVSSVVPAPPGGGEEEWRKKKHRRRPSKKKRRRKPYFKLSWEEKQQLEERESQRAARLRAEMFAKGQPVAPYNTTQFLMEDHVQAEPDLRSGGGTESSEEEPPEEESEGPGSDGTGGPGSGLRPGGFLLKDFSETYERYHTESLQNMSKQQLVREYLELEKCMSRMEDENNRLRRQGGRVPHRLPHKDSLNHAGDPLYHPHNAGNESHHPPTRGHSLQHLRRDTHSDTDPLLRGDVPQETGPLPRGFPLQLPRGDCPPDVEPQERPHPRIRELELEVDRLSALNKQLLLDKRESRLSNSCGD